MLPFQALLQPQASPLLFFFDFFLFFFLFLFLTLAFIIFFSCLFRLGKTSTFPSSCPGLTFGAGGLGGVYRLGLCRLAASRQKIFQIFFEILHLCPDFFGSALRFAGQVILLQAVQLVLQCSSLCLLSLIPADPVGLQMLRHWQPSLLKGPSFLACVWHKIFAVLFGLFLLLLHLQCTLVPFGIEVVLGREAAVVLPVIIFS